MPHGDLLGVAAHHELVFRGAVMVDQTAAYFEHMAKGLGLSVKIPRPSRTTRRVCSATNRLIGVALLGTGAMLKKPALIVLGALGIAGAALLSLDG